MTSNGLVGIAIVFGIAALFWSLPKPPSLLGLNPIERSFPKLVAWRGHNDATATLNVEDRSTGAVLATLARGPDGVLREDPASPGTVRLVETPVLAFGTSEHQLGTVAGYFNRASGERIDRFQLGVHYEPYTVFYGTLALPSLVVTKDLAGIGVVAHLPPAGFPTLSAIGIGAWECAPFDGGRPGLLVGASFHVTVP